MSEFRFDLEKALAAWRRSHEHDRAFLADDLDELEQHVRDQVAGLVAGGMSEEAAFRKAMAEMGNYAVAEGEYKKVYWGKLKRRRLLTNELRAGTAMLKNYLRIALRNAVRSKGYTFINVFGLAMGLASCALIFLFVQNELQYDAYHAHANRIYRVTANYYDSSHWAPVAPPVGPTLQARYPEVEQFVRVYPFGDDTVFRVDDALYEAPGGIYADPSILDVFTVPLVQGDPKTVLDAPGTVVLSRGLSHRLFGDRDPVGAQITTSDGTTLAVTGVMEDVPSTTHLPFDFIVPLRTFLDANGWAMQTHTWAGMYTYLLMQTPESIEALAAKRKPFIDTFYDGVFEQGRTSDQMDVGFQPLRDIHLHSHLEKEYRANGNVTYVYAFSAIAVLVLVIACINFVNLATARASQRLREVGVRKALGALRGQLAWQFLGESLVMAAMALVVAAGLMAALLPAFDGLTGKSLHVGALLDLRLMLGLAGVTLVAGLLSGAYPALVLSGFLPVRALHQHMGKALGSVSLRRGLVVFQFAISIFLIIGTAVVLNQLSYMRQKELGFDKAHVITVKLSAEQQQAVSSGLESFEDELQRNAAIRSVSLATDVPGPRFSFVAMTVDGRQDGDGTYLRFPDAVDYGYVKALGLELVAGRDFSRAAPADTNAWIVNETAVRRLDLKDPLGQVLRWGSRENGYAGPIVGVVKDFHFASLHDAIEPLVMPLRPGIGNTLIVRVQEGRAQEALPYLRDQLAALVPGQLFRYAFLADDFDALYRDDDKLRDVFGAFASLSILIACLGLFGLAAFSAERKTKEIGVRKVLGASVSSILVLLSGEFLKLIGLACIIASPLAYFAMHRWLDAFAYRTAIGPGIFLIAAGVALLVALVTISYQSLRAATTNPVTSLRYE